MKSVHRTAETFLVWMLPLLAISPIVGAAEYQRAPAPAWVTPVTWTHGDAPTPAQVSDGAYYLLTDYQTRVDDDGSNRYRHFAVKALNETGVETIANLEIAFDPSYQSLTLHDLSVIRNGHRVSRLDSTDVRVLQQEKELDYRILNGSKTAHLFLADIRVGDIIDYSYSIEGSNSVFAKRTFGELPLQWSVPVQHLFTRLLLPSARAVAVTLWKTNLQARQRSIGGFREYVWDQSDTAPVENDDDAPDWFDPYPAARWTEFADWPSVARWAVPLYAPAALGPDLQAQVRRIQREQSDPAQRLLAALRLVQRDVRYLGVEIGVGMFSPNAPDLVYQRRFGDCKDKTLLLLSLLHSLGIDARPVLVNTASGRGLEEVQPNPAAFDHVIVQARVGGTSYWLDPTRSVQLSRLDTLFQPDFGFALVVDPSTRGLIEMKSPRRPAQDRSVMAIVDARGGYDKPATYTVYTALRDEAAEKMRDTLASNTQDGLQRQYLNFYASYYIGIRATSPMTVKDDLDANRMTTVEHYLIPNFWPYVKAKKRREANIYAPDMQTYLTAPSSTVRHSPIGLVYPLEFSQQTDVLLPDTWTIAPETTRVDSAYFTFEQTIEGSGARWHVTDRYRSLADNVPQAAAPIFAADLNRARDGLGYFFYVNDSAPPASFWDSFNWMVALLAVLLLLVYVWTARRLYRYDPKPYTDAPIPALTGIRGWLIFPAIGTVLFPLTMLSTIISVRSAFSMPVWVSHTHVGGENYQASWAPLLLFEGGGQLAFLVFSVLIAVVFFQRRRSAPLFLIAITLALFLFHAIDLAVLSLVQGNRMTVQDWSALIGTFARAAIWCPYFLLSRRVRSTFTRTWRVALPPPPLTGIGEGGPTERTGEVDAVPA